MSDGVQVDRADVVVIGGGIAGVSAAYQLSATHRVVLLEREPQLAHHTTGRSAAVYIVNYGGPINMRLTRASRDFFEDPPPALAEHPILEQCGVLMVGDESHRESIQEIAAAGQAVDPSIELIDGEAARSLVPVLTDASAVVGMFEPGGCTMDVMALHQAFLRGAVAQGTTIHRHRGAIDLQPLGTGWRVRTGTGPIDADTVVNAAGAWGDHVARLAGVQPVGLQPMQRTAFTAGIDVDPTSWPLVHIDSAEGPCYFKPEAGRQLLCSPSDEIPSEPYDARPREVDVALAIDRIHAATTLDVRRVKTTWAGLRTFAPDRHPVLGMDPEVDGFCWMVGQGGTGITTSFAAGQVVAAAVRGEDLPPALSELGLDLRDLGPDRIRNR
jgi:D-arginine dehydrogenase